MNERRQGERRVDSVTLEKRLLRLVLGTVAFVVVVALAMSAGSLVIAYNVQESNNKLETANAEIREIQKKAARNTESIRDNGYETCVQGNELRAEQHFRAGLSPPASLRQLAKQLGLDESVIEQTTVKALQKRLPIIDCDPLRINQPARIYAPREQEQYVEEYSERQRPLLSP